MRLWSTSPSVWPGAFTNIGTGATCSTLSSVTRRLSSTPDLERDPVVRRHHDQRLVEQSGAPQPLEHEAHLPVHEAHLEEVARLVVVRERLVVEAHRPVDLRYRVVAIGPALATRGQVDPGLVRQQRVLEVERRPVPLADRADPRVEPRRPAAAGQALEHSGPGAGRAGADARRTQRLARLHVHDPVAQTVHQVVDAARVAAVVGGGPAARAHRVLDRRHGLERRVVDRVARSGTRWSGPPGPRSADSARRRCCRRASAACPRGTRRTRAPPPAAGLACRLHLRRHRRRDRERPRRPRAGRIHARGER